MIVKHIKMLFYNILFKYNKKSKNILENRKLVINSDIDDRVISDILMPILEINKKDENIPIEERKPIYLYIDTEGGNVQQGFALIDVIKHSKTPIYGITLGQCYSMGVLILIACHKKIGLMNTEYLIHKGENDLENEKSKLIKVHVKKDLDRVKTYMINHSKITEKIYNKNFNNEWYFFSDEAKEIGVIDYILGEDIFLKDIY